MEATIKALLTLTKEEYEALQRMAKDANVTLAEMLQAVISDEAFLAQAVEEGSRVLLEDPDETLKELVYGCATLYEEK